MNYMSLSVEWEAVWDKLEESCGELTPEIEEWLDSIQGRTLGALFNLQDLRENAQMGVRAIKERIDALKTKIERLERADANLKKIQIFLLQSSGQKSLENGVYKITLTQNPLRIDVVDDAVIPDTYKAVEVKMSMADWQRVKGLLEDGEKSHKVSVDKKSIGEIYKTAGVEIAGVEYVRDDNVRIS